MNISDFEWFKQNLSELYKQYGACFLVIKDKEVIGSYPTYAEALKASVKQYNIGEFIIQECGATEAVYTNYISSCFV